MTPEGDTTINRRSDGSGKAHLKNSRAIVWLGGIQAVIALALLE